jgi:hypothetical protein
MIPKFHILKMVNLPYNLSTIHTRHKLGCWQKGTIKDGRSKVDCFGYWREISTVLLVGEFNWLYGLSNVAEQHSNTIWCHIIINLSVVKSAKFLCCFSKSNTNTTSHIIIVTGLYKLFKSVLKLTLFLSQIAILKNLPSNLSKKTHKKCFSLWWPFSALLHFNSHQKG